MNSTTMPMTAHAAQAAARVERLLAHPRVADWVLLKGLGRLLVNHEPSAVASLRTSLLKMGASSLPAAALPAMAKVLTVTRRMHEGALSAAREGRPVAWITWPVPAAVVAAFPVLVYCPENFYSVANASGGDGSTRLCELADRHGVPTDICSINRCMLGAFLGDELPPPQLCITANHPCDGNHAGNTILRELAPCPHFSMGAAYDRSPQSVATWARSVWEMIAFLETQLQQPIDWLAVERHARLINRLNKALNHVTELHRNAPAPRLINALAVFWRMVAAAAWEPELADGAELLEEAAVSLVERARRKKAPREPLRVVLGDQAITWTDFSAWIWEEYSGSVVSDYIGHFCHPPIDTSSKESMIEGLVLDRLHMSMIRQSHGTMEYTLDELTTALSEYDADCVLFHGNVGCKHNLALRREIEALCRSIGIPALFLDADIVDRRLIGEQALRQKIKKFLADEGLPR
ncbi:MAG: 2-hydroxyacyl-CoA dehydratase family protein [Myxococcota bacterium]|jgi:benzoyl-CoA reductase/2-hydroxyglutaryl-CoA dehydratase subunit BcrC/BadD/HgdB|nr:2-hydroxyacyl-CoA dehydratase family protein [Myxococcota bacterium]